MLKEYQNKKDTENLRIFEYSTHCPGDAARVKDFYGGMPRRFLYQWSNLK